MAISAVSNGQISPANQVFSGDDWYKILYWKLADGDDVCVYRKSDEFSCKIMGHFDETVHNLTYEGDAEEFYEFLKESVPFRINGSIKFIRKEDILQEHESIADPTKKVTRDIWAITMVSHMQESTGNGHSFLTHSIGMTCLIGGHAYILLEGINEEGSFEKKTIHIVIMDRFEDIPHGYAKPKISEGYYTPGWPKTDTFLRPSQLAQQLLERVRQQELDYREAIMAGVAPPIRFSATSPQPYRGIQNCFTWCFDMFKIVDVRIPLRQFPIKHLNGREIYVPRYHIDTTRELCRQMAEDDIDMRPYAPIEEAIKMKEEQKAIENLKFTVRGMASCIPGVFIVPPLQLAIPLIPFIVAACVIDGKKLNKMEKALFEKKKTYLENYFIGEN
jgi:hypothetical protein